MEKSLLLQYQNKYYNFLMKNCLPFWFDHAIDKEHGGIYTCLNREGEIYNTDKSVWFQGRFGWILAKLCNVYGVQEEWKTACLSCLRFLREHCIDSADRRMYFSVTADGKPLRKRRYFFSETFYIIAGAEASKAFGDPILLETAREYYDLVMAIYRNPEADPFKIYPKVIGETRKARSFANPMILLNVTHILRECDPQRRDLYDTTASGLANDIMKYSYRPEFGLFLETTGPEGEFLGNITGGRTINPGHSIEGVWFLLNQAENAGDKALIAKTAKIFDAAYEIGWDKEFGGIYSFVDALGQPPEQLEHDMKMWWPINETIISSLMLYVMTGEERYWDIFVKTDEYAFSHFADDDYGEWYGYLRRDGVPTQPALKGSLFKGPFHLPRMLIMVEQMLSALIQKS